MLKFQQNQTKAELIKILFVTSLDKGRRTNFCVKKVHESWKLNVNIFFELLLGDLDEKFTSAGYLTIILRNRGWRMTDIESIMTIFG